MGRRNPSPSLSSSTETYDAEEVADNVDDAATHALTMRMSRLGMYGAASFDAVVVAAAVAIAAAVAAAAPLRRFRASMMQLMAMVFPLRIIGCGSLAVQLGYVDKNKIDFSYFFLSFSLLSILALCIDSLTKC